MASKGVMAMINSGRQCLYESRCTTNEAKILDDAHLMLNVAVVESIIYARDHIVSCSDSCSATPNWPDPNSAGPARGQPPPRQPYDRFFKSPEISAWNLA